ncbi:FAD-binding oxidoreductase [Frankia sp. Cr2]|uniref:FAD-binding oxidoreductase n=1 Tax=Frankia sp. Cr2 TaxID=3073932 RepID=UPI002AD30067|nr:FAD-binding oxidoreductase [Frankia sp. Cr2]
MRGTVRQGEDDRGEDQRGENRLIADLVAALGADHVLVDRDLTAGYETDWTGAFTGRAAAVARPASTGEVAAVLRVCAAHGRPVVPQGGNTGLVGGSVPAGAATGAVVLSLRRLTAIDPVDTAAGLVTAAAGATLADVQTHLRTAGYTIGVDLAARDSATLGGIAATNAGGERVLRHGMTRSQIAGLEAVLADGRLVRRLSGLPKDNVGYDLPALLVGSEGTLGVITRVQLRLIGLPRARTAALIAMADLTAAVNLVALLRATVGSLDAVELMFDDGITLVCDHQGLPTPFPGRISPVHNTPYLLVECVGRTDPADELATVLETAAGVLHVAVATTAMDRRRLWTYRDGHTAAVNALGVPVKLDVAVPLTRITAFVDDLPALVRAVTPSARLHLWGHLAEANLHVNITGPDRDDTRSRETLAGAILTRAAADGGSIGAEHGVGRAKMPWIGMSRSPDELAVMTAVKHALDPAGLLNPGVLVPPYGIGRAADPALP